MAKIWCEKCNGTGEKPGQNPLAMLKWMCKDCHGKGYTEDASHHYEALLAAERSKVIAEVREWSEKTQLEMYGLLRQSVVLLSGLNVKLDSMEQEGGE